MKTNLPPARQLKKLGELYNITSSKRVFQSERKNSGIPFYRAREIVKLAKNGFVKNELFISEEMYEQYSIKYGMPKENDIMVTGVGTIGICYLVKKDDKFYFKDGNIIWFQSHSNLIDSRFLEYTFKSNQIRKQIDNTAGTVVATLTIEKAKNIQIPLPPLPIQHSIVAYLDQATSEIDGATQALRDQLAKLDALWASELQRALENEEREKRKIKDISSKIQYGYTGKVVEKSKFRYLRITDIQNGKVERETVPFCDIDDKEALKYELSEGDIVFARTGATVGKSFLVDKGGNGHVFASYLIRISVLKDLIKPSFLTYFFQSKSYRDQISKDVVGAAQPNFNGSKLAEVIVTLPPLSTQLTIVSHLDAAHAEISQLRQQYTDQLHKLAELKASVMDEVFSGKWKGAGK